MTKWIEWKWTPEKPYPEPLDKAVVVRFRDWPEEGSMAVGDLWHPDNEYDHWFQSGHRGDITHYRLASEENWHVRPSSKP